MFLKFTLHFKGAHKSIKNVNFAFSADARHHHLTDHQIILRERNNFMCANTIATVFGSDSIASSNFYHEFCDRVFSFYLWESCDLCACTHTHVHAHNF